MDRKPLLIGIAALVAALALTTGTALVLALTSNTALPSAGPPKPSLTACSARRDYLVPARSVPAPPTAAAVSGPLTMTIETTRGMIEVELDRTKTPCTAAFLGFLAQNGFYDRTVCHRLTTAGIFILQCGDPAGTGMGGPGFEYDEENLPSPAPAPWCPTPTSSTNVCLPAELPPGVTCARGMVSLANNGLPPPAPKWRRRRQTCQDARDRLDQAELAPRVSRSRTVPPRQRLA